MTSLCTKCLNPFFFSPPTKQVYSPAPIKAEVLCERELPAHLLTCYEPKVVLPQATAEDEQMFVFVALEICAGVGRSPLNKLGEEVVSLRRCCRGFVVLGESLSDMSIDMGLVFV